MTIWRSSSLSLTLVYVLSAAACSSADTTASNIHSGAAPAPKSSPQPIPAASARADFARVFAHFQDNANLGSAKPIDASYQPEVILPQLHSYFKVGQTLKPYRAGGFKGYLLRKLPPQVLHDLQSTAYGADQNTGFAVLQASFWSRAADLMKQSFKIGFVESDPNNSINGVYFHDTKTIFIDVEANAGVLEHEYHHHVQ